MPLPALLGAALPGLAGVAGGALGGLFSGNNNSMGSSGGRGNFLTGYGSRTEQLPRFSQQQQNALQALLSQGLSNSNLQSLEKNATNQFNQQIIPMLSERFSSMGNNALSSPAFASQLGQAGSGLASQLAALRSQYGLQQLQMGLSPMFENIYTPASPGLLQPLGQGLGSLLPLLLGLYGNQR